MESFKKHKKKLNIAVWLPNYKPLNVIIRFVIISLIAVGVLSLIVFVVGDVDGGQKTIAFYYILIILAFNMSAEFQIAIDYLLEYILPVPRRLKLRLFIQISLGIIMLVITMKVIMAIIDPEIINENTRPAVFMGLITGLLFVQLIANTLTTARLTQKWMDQQEEIAEMKREKLRMDYNSLQDQLNPHFLFNNLSVLKSLITYDQKTALEFTENFTDVYRYVLQSKDRILVKLNEELDFIGAYIGLHKERLGEGLQVHFSIQKEDIFKSIAPLTLQLLVENAIKHNIASSENPLEINIKTENGFLCISNSLQPRATSYSTQTGLGNLAKRYEMLGTTEIDVKKGDYSFEVKVPLM